MGSIYTIVGRRVADVRRNRRWTQERLAEAANVATSYVARIESGKRQATLETLGALAKALGVPLAALLGSADGEPAKAGSTGEELLRAIRFLDARDRRLLAELARRLVRDSRRRGQARVR